MRAAENLDEPDGFSMRRVPSSGSLLAFDVERCPLATFFAEHEAPEVGPLICKLDDLLAGMRSGVTLERTGDHRGRGIPLRLPLSAVDLRAGRQAVARCTVDSASP